MKSLEIGESSKLLGSYEIPVNKELNEVSFNCALEHIEKFIFPKIENICNELLTNKKDILLIRELKVEVYL